LKCWEVQYSPSYCEIRWHRRFGCVDFIV